MTQRIAVSRRSMLTALAAGAAVGIAGCSDGPANAEPTGSDDETTFPDHPVDEPMAVPAERQCDGTCGMTVADWPNWNAQVSHENGKGAFFCSPGDMVLYTLAPEASGAPDAPIANAWVSEYGSGELIEAESAHWVLDDDPSRLQEPMSLNPKPFADRADAAAFVDQYDDLDEGDIIRYGDFTRDNADRYSGHRIPPWEQ